MNKFIGIGNLTRDAELKHTTNGTPVTTFTIAINGFKKDDVDYLNVVTYNKVAENVAHYCGKGSKVAVEGTVKTRNYENKQGQKVYVTEIIASSVQFLSSKQDQGQAQGGYQQQSGYQQQNTQANDGYYNDVPQHDISEDDLPF